MNGFKIFTIVALVIIYGCLAFLFYTVLSTSGLNSGGSDLPRGDTFLYHKEYALLPEGPGGPTYREYLNNLEYYKEDVYNVFRNSREVTSFLYYDLITGYSFGYNEDVEFPSASSIKANLAVYIMDMVSQGRVNLEKKLTYTQDFHNPGSGRLKNQAPGTQYSIDQLLTYMMVDSDNVAYLMLLNEFGPRNVQSYWFSLGATTTYKRGASWGTMTAADALLYMRRLYSFYMENEQYGGKLIDLFIRSNFRYLFHDEKDIAVAHKSGNTTLSMNDLALILDKHPFIFVVLTRKDAFDTGHMEFFGRASATIYAFHQYYWNNIHFHYTP